MAGRVAAAYLIKTATAPYRAAAMMAAADHTGMPLIVHENFRWQLPFLTLKRLIHNGRIEHTQFAASCQRQSKSEPA